MHYSLSLSLCVCVLVCVSWPNCEFRSVGNWWTPNEFANLLSVCLLLFFAIPPSTFFLFNAAHSCIWLPYDTCTSLASLSLSLLLFPIDCIHINIDLNHYDYPQMIVSTGFVFDIGLVQCLLHIQLHYITTTTTTHNGVLYFHLVDIW